MSQIEERRLKPRSARRITVAAWLAIAIAYLATRLSRLTLMPLFADEGTYLWWGRQLLLGDLTRGWGQGKPLSGWLIALPLALGANPVLATRLSTVCIGALGLAATAYLTATVLSTRAALITSVLWVLLPYTLFFERLATPDVLLGCLVMLALTLAWSALHADRIRPVLSVTAGAVFVLAALAKLPVSLFFFSLPASILLVSPPARGRAGRANALLLVIIPALFAAAVVAIGAYRWSTGARPIGFGFDDVLLKSAIGAPHGSPVVANLIALLSWGPPYLTWPVMPVLGFAWLAAWFGPPLTRLLAGAASLWLAIFVSVASYWVPRYVWPVLPALLVVLGWGLAAGVERLIALAMRPTPLVRPQRLSLALAAAGMLGLVILVAPFLRALVSDPSEAALPAIDQQGYISNFGSGYGFPEAAAYVDGAAAPGPTTTQVIALTIHDEARLRAYLAPAIWPRLRQVHIVEGQNQDGAQQLARLKSWLPEAQVTYVVVASGIQWGSEWRQAFPQAVLDRQFPKPGAADAVQVWRIAMP